MLGPSWMHQLPANEQCLDSKASNSSLWAKSSPVLVFFSKCIRTQSHDVASGCPWLHFHYDGRFNSCSRRPGTWELKCSLFSPFCEKLLIPCTWLIREMDKATLRWKAEKPRESEVEGLREGAGDVTSGERHGSPESSSTCRRAAKQQADQ